MRLLLCAMVNAVLLGACGGGSSAVDSAAPVDHSTAQTVAGVVLEQPAFHAGLAYAGSGVAAAEGVLNPQIAPVAPGRAQSREFSLRAGSRYVVSVRVNNPVGQRFTVTLRAADASAAMLARGTYSGTGVVSLDCFSPVDRAAVAEVSVLGPGAQSELTIERADVMSLAASPDPYFGIHLHAAGAGTDWPSVPFGSWRLWDAYVAWPSIEPSPGAFNFNRLDRYVDIAASQGLALILPLGLSPRWASARPDEESAYGPGQAAEPADIAAWERYVTALATRYKGKISAYEIWNEPNAVFFYSGSISKLVELTCAAHRLIRSIDPGAQIVSPGATYQEAGAQWLDEFLAAGGGACVDIIGFHFYTQAHEAPEALVPISAAVRAAMRRHQQDAKPLWNTESGWFVQNRSIPVGVPWRVLGPQTAANYAARALILGRSLGFGRFAWYAWDDGKLGLLETEDKTLKPAAAAHQSVYYWTQNAAVSCNPQTGGLWVCAVSRAGRTTHIAWSVSGATEFAIPSDWGASAAISILDEAPTDLASSGTLTIGEAPTLIY